MNWVYALATIGVLCIVGGWIVAALHSLPDEEDEHRQGGIG